MQQMDAPTTQHTTKLLREIEDIVLDLDRAIATEHMSHQDLEEITRRFAAADALLEGAIDKSDSRRYIRDEAVALLAWINGDKKAATVGIAVAISNKGDTHLVSQAGRGLAATITTKPSPKTTARPESPVSSWLGFFYATVTLAMVGLVLMTLGATVALFFAPVSIATGVATTILWLLSGLAIAYLVLTPRQSRHAPVVAILFFGSLTLLCIILLLGVVIYGDYDDTPGFGAFVQLTLLCLIACGAATTAYYQFSQKVRRVFTR